MHLYSCKAGELVGKSGKEIVEIFEKNLEINDSFENLNEISGGERRSWEKSIPVLVRYINEAGLENLNLIFEQTIPMEKKRIDVMIVGKGKDNKSKILIVELKQWSYLENYNDDDFNIKWNWNGTVGKCKHPCVQVDEYYNHLILNHNYLSKEEVNIKKAILLHNLECKKALFYKEYKILENEFFELTFARNDSELFKEFLKNEFINKVNTVALKKIENGRYVFSQVDYNCIKKAIENKHFANMLSDQKNIISDIRENLFISNNAKSKKIFIISGNVGTGKSILGMELLREYIEHCKENTVAFTIPSKAIKQVLAGYVNDEKIVKYTSELANGSYKFAIIDEAHRIVSIENTLPKILRTCENIIILQDDKQRINISEGGTITNIEKIARKHVNDIEVYKYKLNINKRNQVASGYVEKINEFLYSETSEKMFENTDHFKINIAERIEDLKKELNTKFDEKKYMCKFLAPFCWRWTYKEYKSDVKILGKPWNPFEKNFRSKNKIYKWATYKTSKAYFNEVGCIYTSQGLEFDYTGVIFWDDLVYRDGEWKVDLNKLEDDNFIENIVKMYGGSFEKNKDARREYLNEITKEKKWVVLYQGKKMHLDSFLEEVDVNWDEIIDLLKNIYRILLTRAKRGSFIWFKDEETKKHFIEILNI